MCVSTVPNCGGEQLGETHCCSPLNINALGIVDTSQWTALLLLTPASSAVAKRAVTANVA